MASHSRSKLMRRELALSATVSRVPPAQIPWGIFIARAVGR